MDKRSITSADNGKKSKGRPITRHEHYEERLALLRAASVGTTDPAMREIWATQAQKLQEKLDGMPVDIAGETHAPSV
jgi:hypothetical protein